MLLTKWHPKYWHHSCRVAKYVNTMNVYCCLQIQLNRFPFFSPPGFNDRDMMMIFQILSGVLHFGNVKIVEKDGESSEMAVRQISRQFWKFLLNFEFLTRFCTVRTSFSIVGQNCFDFFKHFSSRIFFQIFFPETLRSIFSPKCTRKLCFLS